MRVGIYNADTLRADLKSREQEHGISTEEAVKLHRLDADLPPGLSRFDVFVWASDYHELQRITKDRS